MPDVYATLAQQPRDVVETIAHAMETRTASPQRRAILKAYLPRLDFPDHARVLEIGCGTGPVVAALAQWLRVAEVVGVNPHCLVQSPGTQA
jgi:methylase of polypeptide subunit release factors